MIFRKKKDSELDYTSLNEILKIGSKLSEIFYVIAIIAIVILGTHLIKEWEILGFIGEFFAVISPIWLYSSIFTNYCKFVLITILNCSNIH